MTNQEIWTQYKEYSQTVSDIARRFAFAGIAICWLFKDSDTKFPAIVFSALLFFVIFFIIDLLQYLISTILLRFWMRKQEIKKWEITGKIEGNYHKPNWIDKPAFSFFTLKLISLFFAFYFLASWLFKY